ncbi:hypothetical protein [Pseudomonas sp. MWU12-2323]|uniref:hypothetical protein n=1 Tax=Pseudomonas sp. MWU12-2323 TaxID=2651296 RepID=UPI00128C89D0|nr:hypothetical protein [Pseudomonas sp. MWU12-2323]MPQ69377.1 hypothetical protein [Pseudomonas sp. MWU12-2323]
MNHINLMQKLTPVPINRFYHRNHVHPAVCTKRPSEEKKPKKEEKMKRSVRLSRTKKEGKKQKKRRPGIPDVVHRNQPQSG